MSTPRGASIDVSCARTKCRSDVTRVAGRHQRWPTNGAFMSQLLDFVPVDDDGTLFVGTLGPFLPHLFHPWTGVSCKPPIPRVNQDRFSNVKRRIALMGSWI